MSASFESQAIDLNQPGRGLGTHINEQAASGLPGVLGLRSQRAVRPSCGLDADAESLTACPMSAACLSPMAILGAALDIGRSR